ncbi:MAG: hypothetical protein LCH61_05235 [Proteobacteria bacterium]|nr:hypothetical protein [Pseudomonadota bacterium]
MRLMDFARRSMQLSLALLPPVCVAVYIALHAKNQDEVAAVILWVAGAVTVANLVQVMLLIRDNRRLASGQDETRRQALALARCMKQFNQRLAEVEHGGGDVRQGGLAAPTASSPFTQGMAPLPSPQRRIVSLPHRRLAGVEPLALVDGASLFRRLAGSGDLDERLDVALDLIRSRTNATTFVLIGSDLPLSASPALVAEIASLAQEEPGFSAGFMLGISQNAIRSGGAREAEILATLARAGIRFMLSVSTETGLDARALAACNINHVRIDIRQFLNRMDDLRQLNARLADAGVAVVADHVDDPRHLPEIVNCGIRLAAGAAFETGRDAPAMPWRAAGAPERTAPLRARSEDSIRFRATG